MNDGEIKDLRRNYEWLTRPTRHSSYGVREDGRPIVKHAGNEMAITPDGNVRYVYPETTHDLASLLNGIVQLSLEGSPQQKAEWDEYTRVLAVARGLRRF